MKRPYISSDLILWWLNFSALKVTVEITQEVFSHFSLHHFQGVLTPALILTPSWWNPSSRLSQFHHMDDLNDSRKIPTTSPTSPGPQAIKANADSIASCSGNTKTNKVPLVELNSDIPEGTYYYMSYLQLACFSGIWYSRSNYSWCHQIHQKRTLFRSNTRTPNIKSNHVK